MTFDLDRHAFRLLKDEPFFASISRNVNKIQNRGIPTAGVMVNQTTHFFELHYNPDFLDNLGKTDFEGNELEGEKQLERRDTEIRAILKHEFYHLIFNHLTERLPDGKMTQHPQCFSGHDELKTDENFPIEAYRAFYRVDKLRFARYKYTQKPQWLEGEVA